MEKKEFNKFEKARIKRTAQNVDQYVSKKNKLAEKVMKMQEEIDGLQQLIDLSDAPIKLMTGGYGVEQLVKKVVTPTDKLDKNGCVIKVTSFELIYPDTVVPPVIEVPDTTGEPGSDYDIDSEVNIESEEMANEENL